MWGHGFGCGDDTDGASDWLNAFISPRLPLVDVKYCAAAASDADGGVDGDSCQGKQWKRSTRPIVDVSVGVKHGARRVASHLASSLVLKPPLIEWERGLGPCTLLMVESNSVSPSCGIMGRGARLCWMVTDAVGSADGGQTRVRYSGGHDIKEDSGKHCYIFVLLMQTDSLAHIDCLGATSSPPPKGPREDHHDMAFPCVSSTSPEQDQVLPEPACARARRDSSVCCRDWNFGEFLRRNPSLVAAAHNYFYSSLLGN